MFTDLHSGILETFAELHRPERLLPKHGYQFIDVDQVASDNKEYYVSNAENLRVLRRARHSALSPEQRKAVNRASKLRARIRRDEKKQIKGSL